jgi:hypothetical protein
MPHTTSQFDVNNKTSVSFLLVPLMQNESMGETKCLGLYMNRTVRISVFANCKTKENHIIVRVSSTLNGVYTIWIESTHAT